MNVNVLQSRISGSKDQNNTDRIGTKPQVRVTKLCSPFAYVELIKQISTILRLGTYLFSLVHLEIL